MLINWPNELQSPFHYNHLLLGKVIAYLTTALNGV